MEEWYSKSWNQVIKALHTDAKNGLTTLEVEKRIKKTGDNKIIVRGSKKVIELLSKNIFQFWFLYMLCTSILLFIYGDIIYSILVFLLCILMLISQIYIKNKTEKDLMQIERLNDGVAKCFRDGKIVRVDQKNLVVGDIILFEKGYTIPADLRVIECSKLKVNENSVTGNNFNVEKYEVKIEEKLSNISQMKNILFKGSVVVDGDGTGVVIACGMKTQIGKIVKNLKLGSANNYFLEYISKNINKIYIHTIPLILLLIVFNILTNNSRFFYTTNIPELMFLVSINCIPIVSYIFIKLATKQINNEDIELHKIDSIKSISEISVVFLNQIGSFTERKMELREIFTNGNTIDLNEMVDLKEYETERMLHIGLLCNNYILERDEVVTKEDLISKGIIEFAYKNNIYKGEIEKSNRRIFEIPYDNNRKIMTTVNKVDSNFRANVKGDPEEILKRCTFIMKNGLEVELADEDVVKIKNMINDMSNRPLSVEGLAYRNFNYKPSIDENIESYLVFVGLAAFENPHTEDLYKNLEDCKKLKVKPILMMEESNISAKAFGKKINMVKEESYVTEGTDLKYLNKNSFIDRIMNSTIFTRIFNEQKRAIVTIYEKYGDDVAFCGSNFTDLPAMSSASVAIAFGNKNDHFLKKMSDVFISTNLFNNILNLIYRCRIYVNNIKNTVAYIMSCIFAEILLVEISYFLGIKTSFDHNYLFWINNVCVTLNSLSILFQNTFDSTMHFKLLSKKAAINYVQILFISIIMSMIVLAAIGMGSFIHLNNINLIYFAVLSFCQILMTKLVFLDIRKMLKINNYFYFINIVLQIIALMFLANFNLYRNMLELAIVLTTFTLVIVLCFIIKKSMKYL